MGERIKKVFSGPFFITVSGGIFAIIIGGIILSFAEKINLWESLLNLPVKIYHIKIPDFIILIFLLIIVIWLILINKKFQGLSPKKFKEMLAENERIKKHNDSIIKSANNIIMVNEELKTKIRKIRINNKAEIERAIENLLQIFSVKNIEMVQREKATETFANNLKRLRQYRGLTQEELAKKVGLTKDTISKIELGKQENVGFKYLISICRELDIRIEELFIKNYGGEKNIITHTEEIMRAVAILIKKEGKNTFGRREIRDQIGIKHDKWMLGYTAIFQGMRSDHPGKAPNVGKKFKNVFRRIEHGVYILTDYGKQLLKEFEGEI